MDNVIMMVELLNQPAIYWSMGAFVLIVSLYSAYKLIRGYALLADVKKKRVEMEAELSKINAKLEDMRNKLAGKKEN